MKPQRKADEATLRQIIDAMPKGVGTVVREACKKHGLLPGGGHDAPKVKGGPKKG